MVKWAGHLERKVDEKLAKRSDVQKVEGKRRRGRPKMRWADWVKRDLERVKGEWRTTTKGISSWRMLIENSLRDKCEERKD